MARDQLSTTAEVSKRTLYAHFPSKEELVETYPGRTIADAVRLLLTRALGTSPVTITAIARLLNMHPRGTSTRSCQSTHRTSAFAANRA
ncbi:hypothetical protein ALI22I_06090 [Saccharothrix sp. ALI-22-I]|uniref:TetR family transcriptional regulator n=1 Tax=Saccharothrix sp. ALI-22-I TaxID=1933778 RepID=UPI00097BC98B|nr:TetR family transcriptional regulator [Saccharothrix sp. ALI-22-I]ONI92009.1 hypothetical protein ALI22I_06090 [Saccharothrix sp. ALI-22-I]